MASKEFTYSDVSEHTTKKDLYMVIHDKVYDCTSFVDEHPYVGPLIHATHRPQWFADDVSKHPTSASATAWEALWRPNSLILTYRGGEEVLLDVGGQDSTEAFEDVGHSDEAREILDGLLVGTLKRSVRFSRPTANAYST
jgi:cytochrome b involved in lipid metabolism